MGWDIAYHSISPKYLTNISEYCIGNINNVNDTLDHFARVKRNRLLTNYFGNYSYDFFNKSKHPTIFDKVKNKIFNNNKLPFIADLQIWGRPFFVAEENLDQQVQVIESYLNAKSDEELIEIYKTQANLLDSFLFKSIYKEIKDFNSHVPSLSNIFDSLKIELESNKAIFQAALKNEDFEDIEGQLFDPHALLTKGFNIIDFLSNSGAAWMERGLPSSIYILLEATVDFTPKKFPFIQNSSTLLKKYNKKLGLVKAEYLPENYSIGIVVMPEDLLKLQYIIDQNFDKMLEFLNAEYESEEVSNLIMKKITEAIYFCIKTDSMLVESTDIFSGFDNNVT